MSKLSKRKTYTNEFKTMIVELVLSGKEVKELSSEYSLSESTIRTWVKKKAPIEIEGKTTNLEEINKMKKENAKLKEENEILKKAMAIFIKK